jgi:hypothetical protein
MVHFRVFSGFPCGGLTNLRGFDSEIEKQKIVALKAFCERVFSQPEQLSTAVFFVDRWLQKFAHLAELFVPRGD